MTTSDDPPEPLSDDGERVRLIARHARLGWATLLSFVTLGLALELMHAYKLATYLDAKHETRRLMWTLAHAHGVGLGLLHLGFVATLRACFRIATPALALASRLLAAATLLVPLGFFLGGVTTYESDPGGGVFLVPIGAVALWLALLLIARDVFRA